MCIIVLQPIGTDAPAEDRLRTCFENNADGAGFAYAHNGRLRIYKGFFTFRDFYSAYAKAFDRLGTDAAYVLHFRIATAGVINKANCHPFRINPKYVAAHNGCIDGYSATYSSAQSDTSHFIRDVMKRLPDEWWSSKGLSSLLHYRLHGSKLAILRYDGGHKIINEKDGIWETDGCWYSNSGYRHSFKVTHGFNKKGQYRWWDKKGTQQNKLAESSDPLFSWQCDNCDCLLGDDDIDSGECLVCGVPLDYAACPDVTVGIVYGDRKRQK